MNTTKRWTMGLTLVLGLAASPLAQAGLIASDNFSDAVPGVALVGQGGGTGFSGQWSSGGFNASSSSNYFIQGEPLPGDSTGYHVSTPASNEIAGLTRDLTTTLGAAGTTDYFSYLVRPDGLTSGGLYNNFFGLYLNSSTGNDVFFGKPGSGPINDYDVETRGGSGLVDSGVASLLGQTVRLVLRVDFSAGDDRETLSVYPSSGTSPIASVVKSDVALGQVSGLTIYSTGSFSLGDIRVGTSLADVVPGIAVPEPSSILLVGLGGLAAWAGTAVRNRRRVG